jgi:hypothetical protein
MLQFRLPVFLILIGSFLILLLSGSGKTLSAQNTFNYLFKKPGIESAVYMIEDFEGSIIAVGAQSRLGYPQNGAIWKIDKHNDTLSRVYGFTGLNAHFTYIEETYSDYIIAGFAENTNNVASSKFFILRLNHNLEITWQKTIDLNYEIYSSKLKKSGGYYYLLMSAFQNNGQSDPFFIKLNSDFDTVRTYHSGYLLGGQYIYDFMFSQDGAEIYIFGTSYISLPYGEARNEIVFYDTAFNYIGYNVFPKDAMNGDYSIYMQGQWMTDTTFLMYCNYTDFTDFKSQQCFMEMDTSLNIYNRSIIGVPDTNDHGCITSKTYSFSNPDSIHYAGVKNLIVSFTPDEISWLRIGMLNRQLQPYYMRYYGGDAQYWIEFVLHTHDGGMVIHAMRLEDFTYTESDWDAFFLKVNSEGLITGTAPSKICPERAFRISPNPGTDHAEINLVMLKAQLTVFDISGRMIIQQSLTEGKNTVNTSHLPKGLYLYSVKDNKDYIETQKWLKQ